MYTTQTNVENALGRPLTTEESSYFTSVLLPSIDEYINRHTGTMFGGNEEVEVFADGNGTKRLVIPTMWEVTSVKHGDNILSTNAWRAYPSRPPYLAVTRTSGTWQEGVENYSVTGKLGYEAVPADITAVATEMAVGHFTSKRDDNGAGIKSERVGDYSVTYESAMQSLSSNSLSVLQGYVRLSRSI